MKTRVRRRTTSHRRHPPLGAGLSGISVADLTPQIAQQLDLPNGIRGVIVSDLDASVASTDLQKGDVIEEVNQQPVTTVADFRKAVANWIRRSHRFFPFAGIVHGPSSWFGLTEATSCKMHNGRVRSPERTDSSGGELEA